jgi:hypothetical protein
MKISINGLNVAFEMPIAFIKISIILQLTRYAAIHKMTQRAYPFITDSDFAWSASWKVPRAQ